jgi:anti-sigma factor RsiW
MMSSLLQQLENNEAVLLMYLAGELPDADRAEVEQMLAADSALRASLAEMTSLHDHMGAVLSQADGEVRLSRQESAVHGVARAMNQCKAEGLRTPAPSAPPSRSRSRIPVWAYPVAAAAVLVIGMMIFSGKHPAGTKSGTETVNEQIVLVPPAPPEGPVAIIPAATTDDALTRLEKEVFSVGSKGNDLDLFSATPDTDR